MIEYRGCGWRSNPMIREMVDVQRSFRRCGSTPSVGERQLTRLLHGRRGSAPSDRRHVTTRSMRSRSCCSYLRSDGGTFVYHRKWPKAGGVPVRRSKVFRLRGMKMHASFWQGYKRYNVCMDVDNSTDNIGGTYRSRFIRFIKNNHFFKII